MYMVQTLGLPYGQGSRLDVVSPYNIPISSLKLISCAGKNVSLGIFCLAIKYLPGDKLVNWQFQKFLDKNWLNTHFEGEPKLQGRVKKSFLENFPIRL